MNNAHAKGAALAVQMLRELEGDKALAPARNIVLQYLDSARDSRETVAGFASVLSDYIAGCAAGVVADADSYAQPSRGAR